MLTHQLSILTPHPAVPDHHSNKDQTSSLTSCVCQSINRSINQSINQTNNQSLEPTSTPILQLDSTLSTHPILQSLSQPWKNKINQVIPRIHAPIPLRSPSPSVGFKRLLGLFCINVEAEGAKKSASVSTIMTRTSGQQGPLASDP